MDNLFYNATFYKNYVREKMLYKKYFKNLLFIVLILFSSFSNATEKRLTCNATSESYGSDYSGEKKSAQITVTIVEVDKFISIALSGNPNFVVAAFTVNDNKFQSSNYSTSNAYFIETRERVSGNFTRLKLDRVNGDLDVYSRVYVEQLREFTTWQIYGRCKVANQQRQF
jgi:hypothetical protein